jgi:hypothetical protein
MSRQQRFYLAGMLFLGLCMISIGLLILLTNLNILRLI